MTIKQVLTKYPQDETELLLSHLLKLSKEKLYTNPDKNISPHQLNSFRKMLKKYNSGFPMAFILGYKNFLNQRFLVSKSTLIPRPESEWLVMEAVKQIKHFPTSKPTLLDLGTGGGCLGLSVKSLIPSVKVTLADISKNALKIAEKNSKQLSLKATLLQSNLFSKIKGKFDIIIANLPYVPKAQYKKFYNNLKYEPKFALIDQTEDFKLYKDLLINFPKYLKTNGVLFLEIDPSMKTKILYELKTHPQTRVTFTKDLHGLIRYATITN